MTTSTQHNNPDSVKTLLSLHLIQSQEKSFCISLSIMSGMDFRLTISIMTIMRSQILASIQLKYQKMMKWQLPKLHTHPLHLFVVGV